MMMDMIRPDSGETTVLSGPMREATKDRLGYLPEERGLHKKLTVIETIVCLASLKGMDCHGDGGPGLSHQQPAGGEGSTGRHREG